MTVRAPRTSTDRLVFAAQRGAKLSYHNVTSAREHIVEAIASAAPEALAALRSARSVIHWLSDWSLSGNDEWLVNWADRLRTWEAMKVDTSTLPPVFETVLDLSNAERASFGIEAPPNTKQDVKRHAEWLVRVHFAHETYNAIAKQEYNDPERRRDVQVAVQQMADFAGFTLRPIRRGRPKRAVTPHI